MSSSLNCLRTPLVALLAWSMASVAGASVPYPDLSGAEPYVREQLESARRAHDHLVSGSEDSALLAESYGRLAQLYHAYDLTVVAATAYARASELAPSEFRWLYLAGFLQQIEGRLEQSIETLLRALAVRPNDIPTLLRLADQDLELQRTEAAERLYRRVVALDATSAAALEGLGRSATTRGNHRDAIANFEQALARRPQARHLHYLLGMAYRRVGDLERARYHLERQGPVQVTFDDPLVVQLSTLASGSAVSQHKGFLAKMSGDPARAAEEYRLAVEADPTNAEARRGFADALRERGELKAAIEQYRELLRIDSNPAASHFLFAGVLEESGSRSESLTHYRAAVELEPEYRMFRYALARALMQGEDFDGAEIHFRRLVELDSREVSSRLHLGEILAARGEDPEAREQFQAVLASDASPLLHAVAFAGQGRLVARSGDTLEAIALYERALELDSSLVGARFALANLRGRSGDLAGAAADYRQVIDLVPEHVLARVGEVTALLLAQREDEALRRLEEGRRLLPDEAAIADALARFLASGSDPKLRDGTRALQIALELYTESGSLEHGETVAMALAELERFEEAIDWQSNLLAEAGRRQDPALAARFRRNLERYEQGQPARIR